MGSLGEPEAILLVKLSAIGDVVHTLPVLESLRARFPRARIDWLVEEEGREIVSGHPALNRLIVSRRKSWQKRLRTPGQAPAVLREAARFLRDLRSEDYDLVIDLQGLFKSALLTGLARGRRKVGPSGGREGSRLVLTERPVPVDYGEHAIDRYLRVAEALGCPVDRSSGRVPVSEEDEAAVERLIRECGLKGRRIIAVNPMARWPSKLWEPARFVVLVDRIAHELEAAVVLTGGPDDRSLLEAIRRSARSRPVNLAGRTTLKQAAGLYARCSALVSTDTGPMHLAAAMGCPVVALFGPTAPWRTGPHGPGHRVVRVPLPCSPCFRKTCDTVQCMKEITPERVMGALGEVLEGEAALRGEPTGEVEVRGVVTRSHSL